MPAQAGAVNRRELEPDLDDAVLLIDEGAFRPVPTPDAEPYSYQGSGSGVGTGRIVTSSIRVSESKKLTLMSEASVCP